MTPILGTQVRFRRVSDRWMNLWIDWFHNQYGQGPYQISEVMQSAGAPLYKLQPCPDVAFSRSWLKVVREAGK